MANKKITELTALTDPDANDLLAIVDDPSGSPETKRITATKLVKSLNNQAATFVVAASDSLHKERADYICDGVNDQVEIQAAIDALPSGGGKIVLTEGTFNITDSIDLSGKGNILFGGMGTCTFINNQNTSGEHAIKAINSSSVPSSTVRYLIFSDFIVKGNTASGDGLHFERVDCLKVDGIVAEKNGEHGLYFINNFWTVGADTAYGDTMITNSFFLTNDKYGIFMKALHEPLINDCHIEENLEGGIWHENGFNLVINGCSIEDNVNNKGIVIYANGAICPVSLISGTTLEDNIVLKSCVTHAPYAVTVTGNTIDANILMERTFGDMHSHEITIIGNTFRAGMLHMTFVKFLSIIGNVFGGVVNPLAAKNSIRLENCLNVAVVGNTGRSYAPFIYLSGDYSENVVISNNVFKVEPTGSGAAEPYGILIGSSLNVVRISNNIITRYSDTDMTVGIKLKSGANVCCNDNIIKDATTGIVDNTGEASIYEQHSNHFMDVLAASANDVHAAITGTGAEQEITTAITNPDIPRNISITNSANSTGDVKIDGVDAKGKTVSDTITIVTGGIAYGVVAFATVSKITIPAGVANPDTIAVGVSDKLGLSNIIYASGDVYKVKVNNADDPTIGTVNTTYNTVDCATINAGDDITIWYKSNLNIIS